MERADGILQSEYVGKYEKYKSFYAMSNKRELIHVETNTLTTVLLNLWKEHVWDI